MTRLTYGRTELSCVLRIMGRSFEPSSCAEISRLNPYKTYRKDQPKYPRTKPDGPFHEDNGVFIEVSDQDGDHVPMQIVDAVRYLESNRECIATAARCAGVEKAYLDFDWWFPVGDGAPCGQYNYFDRELVALCAEVGIGIVVTVGARDA